MGWGSPPGIFFREGSGLGSDCLVRLSPGCQVFMGISPLAPLPCASGAPIEKCFHTVTGCQVFMGISPLVLPLVPPFSLHSKCKRLAQPLRYMAYDSQSQSIFQVF